MDVSYTIDAPPSVVWQYWVQPEKRARWSLSANETSVVFLPNDDGRRATGGSSHCAHAVGGDALREYLDWRPNDYFTCRMTPLPHELVLYTPWIETCTFTSVGENRTEWRWTVRCIDRSAEVLTRFETLAAGVRERATQPEFGEMMRAAIAEDASSFGLEEATD